VYQQFSQCPLTLSLADQYIAYSVDLAIFMAVAQSLPEQYSLPVASFPDRAMQCQKFSNFTDQANNVLEV